MPETAMHEDGDPAADEGDVGGAGNVAPVEPVARRYGADLLAQDAFGLCILALYGAHDVGAGGHAAA